MPLLRDAIQKCKVRDVKELFGDGVWPVTCPWSLQELLEATVASNYELDT